MSGVFGDANNAQKLEGREDDSRPREFFWDSVTLYIVYVILGLAALDAITEFLRGSSIACYVPGDEVGDSQVEYINNYCSTNLPRTEYFPAFIVVHGILIAIPHYLWLNHYGGNFDFFFSQAREMDRTRDEDTGEYSEKNRIIIQQLSQAFATFNQNWMFILYVCKLILQLGLTLAGFVVAIIYFTDFDEIFYCPRDFNLSMLPDEFWPLEEPVRCVFTALQLFSTIRIADLILLALLVLTLAWSLVWSVSTHSTELGTDQVALFCFHSGMGPEHHVPKFPLGWCCRPFKKCFRKLFTSIPWFGPGPRIKTNMDFLVLKLFRTDSGLGFIFREMQILQKIHYYNDDDQRRTNVHKRQQQTKSMGDGDLIEAKVVKGYGEDLRWLFTKKTGEAGIFSINYERLAPTDTLVLPDSLRGTVVGFSSLAPKNSRALYVTFGAESLGIPLALSRVFTKVGVVNFNPFFKQVDAASPFVCKTYASDIVHVQYPEDILASEIERISEFATGLEGIWEGYSTADFVVIGPVDNELHLSTLTLFLVQIAKIPQPPKSRFSQGCVLLTIVPTAIGSKETMNEFHPYHPPTKFFEPFSQRICIDKQATSLEWPPKAPETEPREHMYANSFDLSVNCGDSHSTFQFNLYKFPPKKPVKKPAQAAPSLHQEAPEKEGKGETESGVKTHQAFEMGGHDGEADTLLSSDAATTNV